MSKILILANHYNTLRIFRKDLILRLINEGHEVYVSIPKDGDESLTIIESYGCKVIETPMQRRGMNPFKDLALIKKYKKIIKEVAPDIVLTYTMKCNIYGAIAAKKFKVPCFSFITGLGSMFNTSKLKRKIAVFLYKHSLKRVKKVFFENEGNRQVFLDYKIVKKENTVVTAGAGVNLDDFPFKKYPEDTGITEFLFISRIMKEKGVDELFEVIDRFTAENAPVKFSFLGWFEEDYKERVERLSADGVINFYGFQPDVKPYIEKANCIILPSYHEGMSNALLEAAASGRPLVTSNIHGCMEAVEEGFNGYLCQVKSADSLYEALDKFYKLTYEEKTKMGKNSRTRMEEIFDKKKVVDLTVKEIFG